MTRHTPSDSPCDDPAHSQHRLSPAESKIQNQKIDFPPEARLGCVMARQTPSTCRIQNPGACLCLVRILSRIQGEGAEFKIMNQQGLVGGNGERGSESRIQNHERGLVATESDENPEFRIWTRVRETLQKTEENSEFRVRRHFMESERDRGELAIIAYQR